jgi:hypothetical protein
MVCLYTYIARSAYQIGLLHKCFDIKVHSALGHALNAGRHNEAIGLLNQHCHITVRSIRVRCLIRDRSRIGGLQLSCSVTKTYSVEGVILNQGMKKSILSSRVAWVIRLRWSL